VEGYPSKKLTIKAKLPKSPFFIIGDEYEAVMKDGRKVKAGDIMPGDTVVLPMPLFPGASMDLDCVIVKVEQGPPVPKPAGIGCFYVKEEG
jgi:hypothetical protein